MSVEDAKSYLRRLATDKDFVGTSRRGTVGGRTRARRCASTAKTPGVWCVAHGMRALSR